MDKDEFAKLLVTACDGNSILGVITAERKEHEKQVLQQLMDNKWGIVCVGDAVQQFYFDTTKLFVDGQIDLTRIGETDSTCMRWHAVTQSRLYIAHDLLCRGYYYDSMTMSRSLFETALIMIALEKSVVPISDLFSNGLTGRAAAKHDMNVDRKIKNALIWENTKVSDEVRKAIGTILHLVNTATHKSKLHLLMDARKTSPNEALLPHYDERVVEVTSNILYLTTWLLMASLHYLSSIITTVDKKWPTKHTALMEALSIIGSGPSVAAKGFSEFIKVVI